MRFGPLIVLVTTLSCGSIMPSTTRVLSGTKLTNANCTEQIDAQKHLSAGFDLDVETKCLRPIKNSAAHAKLTESQPLFFLADLQYHQPFQEFFGAEGLMGNVGPPVYHHVGVNYFLPYATRWALEWAIAGKYEYGVLNGDIADVACFDELDTILNVLEKKSEQIKFIIVLGNHDMAPFGAMSPDNAEWQPMWQRACKPHGGVLSKDRLVARVVEYYKTAWGGGRSIRCPEEPREKDGAGCKWSTKSTKDEWNWKFRLEFDRETRDCGATCAHKENYLFQQFQLGPVDSPTTVTVLDSVDYSDSELETSAPYSRVLKTAIAGGVSKRQVKWLNKLPAVKAPHIIATHYMPFGASFKRNSGQWTNSYINEASITTNAGESKLEDYLVKNSEDAVVAYAHNHAPLRDETLSLARPNQKAKSMSLVRLPSLIANRAFVTLRDGVFTQIALNPKTPKLAPRYMHAPTDSSLCHSRGAEYLAIANQSIANQSKDDREAALAEILALCSGDSARKWRINNGDKWNELSCKCDKYPAHNRWRCILDGLLDTTLGNKPQCNRGSADGADNSLNNQLFSTEDCPKCTQRSIEVLANSGRKREETKEEKKRKAEGR